MSGKEKQKRSKEGGATATEPVYFEYAFGSLLRDFRIKRKMTVRDVSKRSPDDDASISYGYYAAVESGREQNPSENFVRGVELSLKLTNAESMRLRKAWGKSCPLIAWGIDVPLSKTIDRQLLEDVREVWVAAEQPLEFNKAYLEKIIDNMLNRGVIYTYFMASGGYWDQVLQGQFLKAIKEDDLAHYVRCIEIKDDFQFNLLFYPPFALYIGHQGEPLAGAWAKFTPDGARIETAYEMDQASLMRMHKVLGTIIAACSSEEDALNGFNMSFLGRIVYPRDT